MTVKIETQRWYCKRCDMTITIDGLPTLALYCAKGHMTARASDDEGS